jgi:hypothetical protein
MVDYLFNVELYETVMFPSFNGADSPVTDYVAPNEKWQCDSDQWIGELCEKISRSWYELRNLSVCTEEKFSKPDSR